MKVGSNWLNFHRYNNKKGLVMVVRMMMSVSVFIVFMVATTAALVMVVFMLAFNRQNIAKILPLDADSVQYRQKGHTAISKDTHPHIGHAEQG